jgi:hypothetical protein
MTERLVRTVSGLLEKRASRRSFLARFAVAGSALSVAPLRYLLRPGSALSVINCRDCRPGSKCCDGYTVFCCTLTGFNACPANSFMGGWWKCTSYTGNGPCAAEGVRYYIDCNVLPGSSCERCGCANGTCSHRRTCCNVFRYGQCTPSIVEVTPIVCRMIKCVNPCTLYRQCDCTYKQDNTTCGHEEDAICRSPY